jgi:predicted transcriptional regulator
MSVSLPKMEGNMSDERIVELIRDSQYPVLTAKQISDAFGVTRQAVNNRINSLVESGKLDRMEVGSSAVVYYPPGDYSMEWSESLSAPEK